MATFLLLLEGLAAQPSATDEETAAYNRKGEWIGQIARDGILQSGSPLAPTATEVTKDAAAARELQTKDVYGYLVVDVPTLDAAIDLVRQAPHTALGGTTVVRECIAPPGG